MNSKPNLYPKQSHTRIPEDADSADKDSKESEGFQLNPLSLCDFNPKGAGGHGHFGHGTEKEAIFWNPPHQSKTTLSFFSFKRVTKSVKNGENGDVGK